jgi:hypothetical protein
VNVNESFIGWYEQDQKSFGDLKPIRKDRRRIERSSVVGRLNSSNDALALVLRERWFFNRLPSANFKR